VLPMVVAPEAIVESFLSIGSSIMSSHLPSCFILLLNFVGCVPSAPDGSSPRGYKRVFAAYYRLKYFFFTTYFFLNNDKPLLLSYCFFSLLDEAIKPVI
jgi:hypothetical protein